MTKAAPAGKLKGLHDKALLLLGFGGAFRRSELVALEVAEPRRDHKGEGSDDEPSPNLTDEKARTSARSPTANFSSDEPDA
jgi:hypothetical protein